MSDKKICVTLTGPSAAGKSTLEQMLVDRGFSRLTSTTTRPPRGNEKNGREYHFIPVGDFQAKLANGGMVEHIEHTGNYYGLEESEFESVFATGKPVLAVVEPNGAGQIANFGKKKGWDVIHVYIDAPLELLIERFLTRFKEDDQASLDNYVNRLSFMLKNELQWVHYDYDYTVHQFDENTQDAVIAHITKMVKEIQEGIVHEPALNDFV